MKNLKILKLRTLKWNFNVEISQIKKDIEVIEKLGATHIRFEDYDGGCDTNIEALLIRLETTDEYNMRLEIEKKKTKIIEQRELELYNKLKAKYNK